MQLREGSKNASHRRGYKSLITWPYPKSPSELVTLSTYAKNMTDEV
jgi:hypothetical protein